MKSPSHSTETPCQSSPGDEISAFKDAIAKQQYYFEQSLMSQQLWANQQAVMQEASIKAVAEQAAANAAKISKIRLGKSDFANKEPNFRRIEELQSPWDSSMSKSVSSLPNRYNKDYHEHDSSPREHVSHTSHPATSDDYMDHYPDVLGDRSGSQSKDERHLRYHWRSTRDRYLHGHRSRTRIRDRNLHGHRSKTRSRDRNLFGHRNRSRSRDRSSSCIRKSSPSNSRSWKHHSEDSHLSEQRLFRHQSVDCRGKMSHDVCRSPIHDTSTKSGSKNSGEEKASRNFSYSENLVDYTNKYFPGKNNCTDDQFASRESSSAIKQRKRGNTKKEPLSRENAESPSKSVDYCVKRTSKEIDVHKVDYNR